MEILQINSYLKKHKTQQLNKLYNIRFGFIIACEVGICNNGMTPPLLFNNNVIINFSNAFGQTKDLVSFYL